MDTLKVVKMLNSKDIPIKELYGEGMDAIGKFNQVKYINYNQKIQGVIAATDKGSVQVLNNYNHFAFDEKFEFTAHYGPVTQMAVSPDNQHLFTAGQDGSLIIWNIGEYYLQDKIYKLQQQKNDTEAEKKKDNKQRVVDPELAEIVLVKRNYMVEWQ